MPEPQPRDVQPIVFTAVHDFTADADTVWAALTDWKRHADWVPATTISMDSGDGRQEGDMFTATSGWGPLSLVDVMRVVEYRPPMQDQAGRCEIVKVGSAITGYADLHVQQVGEGKTRVLWHEAVTPAGPAWLWKLFAPVLAFGGKVAFGMTLKAVARDL